MDDNKGTSLVFVHSEKGQHHIDSLRTSMRLLEVPVAQAIKENPSMTISAHPHKQRKRFFKYLGKMPFESLVAKYCNSEKSLKSRIKILLKKLAHSVKANKNR